MARPPDLHAELVDEDDPAIGSELIRVRHDDGRTEELHLHDYERLYALPGVYEQIVQERLGCRSPQQVAALLGETVDELGWARRSMRVIDIAAGNGISGEALATEELRPVLGSDIVPAAREAALRDRPGLYDEYLTLDLLALSTGDRTHIRALHANVLSCVAPVGAHAVPPPALAAAAALLAPEALVAYLHDVDIVDIDPVTAEVWRSIGANGEEVARRRYVHRRTVSGAPYHMEAVVWRLRLA
ncbi:MAG TPA: hypothetical protein VE127_11000 [Solirubrobacteraceae bacterium]|nr:hypothetical protein [Solirubrobacteraceae bacterium]